MLVTTLEEIRNVVPVTLSANVDSFKSDFETNEIRFIKKWLGATLYTELAVAYGDGSVPISDPQMTALLPYAQRVIIPLGIAANMDFIQVQISERGLHRDESETHKTPFAYQKREAQNYLLKMGYDNLEGMLDFLETNADDYATWKTSDAYTLHKEMIIPSAAIFQKFYNINQSRRTFQLITPLMRKVEDFMITDALTLDYFNEVKIQIIGIDQPLHPDNALILTKYLRPAVAFLTISEAARALPMEITEDGFVVKMHTGGGSDAQVAPVDRAKLDQIAHNAENTGKEYIARMVQYLNSQASATKYPLYFNSDRFPKTVAPDKEPPENKSIYGAF